jgi:hypothetical protein
MGRLNLDKPRRLGDCYYYVIRQLADFWMN